MTLTTDAEGWSVTENGNRFKYYDKVDEAIKSQLEKLDKFARKVGDFYYTVKKNDKGAFLVYKNDEAGIKKWMQYNPGVPVLGLTDNPQAGGPPPRVPDKFSGANLGRVFMVLPITIYKPDGTLDVDKINEVNNKLASREFETFGLVAETTIVNREFWLVKREEVKAA